MRARTVWRVAKWEVLGRGSGIDRQAAVLAGVSLLLLAALLPVAASTGPAPDDGLYRVGVDPASPYHAPAVAAPKFAVVEPDERAFEAGRLDLLIRGDEIRARDTRTGRAAAAALRAAVERFNDEQMREEPDQDAAFPVYVDLRYVERDLGGLVGSTDGSGGDGGGGDGGAGTSTASPGPDPETGSGDGSGSPTGGAGGLSFGGSALLPAGVSGTPASIAPPFPFASLVLAFVFVIPMNFVVQAYASSVLHDRGNRRGEPLLVAPVSKWGLIMGKAAPYLAFMLAISAATTAVVGGGWLSMVAVVPIALLFLAGGFLAGLLARSHKELTFVLVSVAVGLTTFVFVPAIFADIHPIAAISPLSLVVRDLEATPVGPATIAFSTLPSILAAAVLYGLGAGLYREEDLFTQVPLPQKALDALSSFVTSPRRVGLASVFSIPFVFLAELLVIALLFAIPLGLSLPVLFAAIAAIEELAKSLPAYAGFARGRFDRSPRTAAAVGAFSGVGFFLGEKFAAVAQVVGLFELDLGRIAFELGAGVGGTPSLGLLAVLLFAPLGLHVGTATLTAFGASRGARPYVTALVAAILVHAGYNLGVVVILG